MLLIRPIVTVALLATALTAQNDSSAGEIQLLVRGDDMGFCHSVNVACIEAYKNGIMRSVEVLVPGPWFLEAARMLRENPGLDVGIHLCLTSEWENCKWRPLTRAPSLVDADGYFYPMAWQRDGWPPNTALVQAEPKMEEVEQELRAQIEMAKKHIPRLSHMTPHMGAAVTTPELRAVTEKLSKEYELPLDDVFTPMDRMIENPESRTAYEAREPLWIKSLRDLKPGLWWIMGHPGLDTPEMRAIGHFGYENVAEDRDAETRIFTNDAIKALIQERGIKLVSYADLKGR